MPPPTSLTKIIKNRLHCSYISVPCLGFRVVAVTALRRLKRESPTCEPRHISNRDSPLDQVRSSVAATNSTLYVAQSRRHSVHVAGGLNKK